MIAATIKVAKRCKFIDKVIVSTDSEKILKISKNIKLILLFLEKVHLMINHLFRKLRLWQ